MKATYVIVWPAMIFVALGMAGCGGKPADRAAESADRGMESASQAAEAAADAAAGAADGAAVDAAAAPSAADAIVSSEEEGGVGINGNDGGAQSP